MQKQPFANVLQNRCSKKFRNIHRKTLVLESPFDKVAGLQVFSCESCEIFNGSFFIEHLRWLLLQRFCFTLSFQENVAEYISVIQCIIVLFWNQKSLSFAFIRCTTRCHSLYTSLSLVVIYCHLLWFVVTRYTTRCRSLYHSSLFL